MNTPNDGGPAFPIPTGESSHEWNPCQFGMTLRDYFAAKAMQGMLAAQIHGFNDTPAKGPFAALAYEMADAMLAAREGTKLVAMPDESWFSEQVCEARNRWYEEIGQHHDPEFDYPEGQHPDDWQGAFIRTAFLNWRSK